MKKTCLLAVVILAGTGCFIAHAKRYFDLGVPVAGPAGPAGDPGPIIDPGSSTGFRRRKSIIMPTTSGPNGPPGLSGT
jgi:hypothetical protein